MVRTLLLVFAGAAVLGDGYLSGRWSGRWSGGREVAVAAEKLKKVPLQFGNWSGEAQELGTKEIERAGFGGYALRRYENKTTGAVVNLLVACGRPGPLAVHTPEVCYGASGFVMNGGPQRWPGNTGATTVPIESFWKTTFTKPDPTTPERLRVYLSWYRIRDGKGDWVAADSPRWQFAGQPVLYKLYVTQEFLPGEDGKEPDDSSCLEFFREFLPEFEKVLAVNP